jgi:hypothetical protein
MSSSSTERQAADVRPPVGSAPKGAQRLTGTGTTEATNSTSLTVGEMATFKNTANPIRIVFLSATGGGSIVANTNCVIGPYERFDWLVQSTDAFVAIEAADSASAYEAFVWTSSGLRG